MELSTGLCAQLACIWEATARKPGNVHRYADFEDISYRDFLLSAAAIAPIMESATGRGVGEIVLLAVRATRQVVQTNTNLGIILLLAPLACSSVSDWQSRLTDVLARLGVADSRAVFEAIRLASPGGMGKVDDEDLAKEPTVPFRQIMSLAADRDLIARQYVNGFKDVFDFGVPELQLGFEHLECLEDAVVFCHLRYLADFEDSLIARKLGKATAKEVSERAKIVLAKKWPQDPQGRAAFAEFDAWLRADGHKRNPGTTADLVTASLFVLLRQGTITLPLSIPWQDEHHHD